MSRNTLKQQTMTIRMKQANSPLLTIFATTVLALTVPAANLAFAATQDTLQEENVIEIHALSPKFRICAKELVGNFTSVQKTQKEIENGKTTYSKHNYNTKRVSSLSTTLTSEGFLDITHCTDKGACHTANTHITEGKFSSTELTYNKALSDPYTNGMEISESKVIIMRLLNDMDMCVEREGGDDLVKVRLEGHPIDFSRPQVKVGGKRAESFRR